MIEISRAEDALESASNHLSERVIACAGGAGARELAIARTKVEEAQMWAERADQVQALAVDG